MAEKTTFKRQRVTEEILPSYSITSNIVHQDTNKEKLRKINAHVERLEQENFKLVKQLECSKLTHKLSVQENTQKVAELIKEKNECKARAIIHSQRSEEANNTLQTMKSKHVEVTSELRDSLNQHRSITIQLEQALDLQQKINRDLEYDFNFKEEAYKDEIEGLKARIKSLEKKNEENDASANNLHTRELELTKQVNELEGKLLEATNPAEPSSFNESLTKDYTNVCKQLKQYQTENTKLASELKHYKGVSQNVEYLREEKNSLKQQLLKTEEIKKAKFILEVENANLRSERDAWTRFLESKPEYNQKTPSSIIYDLTNQISNGKYLTTRIEQLEKEIETQNTTIHLLEDHIYQLKGVISEKEREKGFNEEERNVYKRREEILKKHINILQSQLKLYDNEEKNLMEQSYDEKKAARIAELESLLNELENQKVETPKIDNATPIVVSNGPYEKITSGTTILEFLTKIHQQHESYLKDLKEAKAKAQEKFHENINQPQLNQEINKESNKETNKETNTETNNKNIPTEEGRYLSLIENPASGNYAIRSDLLNRLQQENQELIKVQLDNAKDIETILLPKITIINYQKEVQNLKKNTEAFDKRIGRMKSACNDQIQEFKTQVRELLGYNIVFRSEGIVRMEPVVVGHGKLSFLIKYTDNENEDVVLRIVGSDKDQYVEQFADIYQTYVIESRNIPAFLNAVALELYGLNA